MYVWQHSDWPTWTWRPDDIDLEQMASIEAALQLGSHAKRDNNLATLATLMDVEAPLEPQTLLALHHQLIEQSDPDGLHVRAGAWRDDFNGPMQIVTGSGSRRIVHYEAPPAENVDHEIGQFIGWFNAPANDPPLVQAAIAQIWFVAIHPFSDGNGRMARALADLSFCKVQDLKPSEFSLSSRLRLERKDYYPELQAALTGDMDLTPWLAWFVERAHQAVDAKMGSV